MTTTYPGGTQTFNGVAQNGCTPTGTFGAQGYSPAPYAGSTIGSPITGAYNGFTQPGFAWSPSYNWQNTGGISNIPTWLGAHRSFVPTFGNSWSSPFQSFNGFNPWYTPSFSYPQFGFHNWFPQNVIPQFGFNQGFFPQNWNSPTPFGFNSFDTGVGGYNGQFTNGYSTPFFGGYNGQFTNGYSTPFFGGYNGQFTNGYSTPSFGFPWSNSFNPSGFSTNAPFPGAYVNSTIQNNGQGPVPYSGICTQREAA